MRNLLVFCILFTFGAHAQTVPNGNFESWFVGNWQLVPEAWATQNDGLTPMTTQDLDAYEGDYAMRVTALPNGIGFSGFANCTIPTAAIPPSLDFYVKALCEFGGVSVSISFYNNDMEVYSEFWSSGTSIDDWTYVSLQLSQIEPVMTHAVIRAEAFVGDLVPGQAWISVDAMGFGGTLSNDNADQISFELFPNPTKDTFHISGEVNGYQFSLFDLTGKAVKRSILNSTINSIDISELPPGLYLVELRSEGKWRGSQKLVKR
jgi:hypothetical protein